MQLKSLHKNVYKLYCYARTQECLDFYRHQLKDKVNAWETLKSQGVCDKVCQKFVGISRSTYYRYKRVLKDLDKGLLPPSKKPKSVRKREWGEAEMQLVLQIRRENPTYGKAKIAVIIKRDHQGTLSESTVGRILEHLKQKCLVQKSASAIRQKRKRSFVKGHARRWTFKQYKSIKMGERVQIDHMTATKNGICLKHFQGWDRRSKYMDANVYSDAKSSSAKRFLMDFVQNCPFKITSIQVDGGSEFMAEFEEACAKLGLELIVLPPAKPKYNGGVERGNRTFKEEFYARSDILADSIGAFRADLRKALNKYNTYRPHAALAGQTPMEYVNKTISEAIQ